MGGGISRVLVRRTTRGNYGPSHPAALARHVGLTDRLWAWVGDWVLPVRDDLECPAPVRAIGTGPHRCDPGAS